METGELLQLSSFLDKLDIAIEKDPEGPHTEDLIRERERLRTKFKSGYAQKSLTDKSHAKRARLSVGKPKSGGPAQRATYAKELKEARQRMYKQDIADYLQVPEEEIDIETGAGLSQRVKTGWLATETQKGQRLINQYGKENIRFIPDGNSFAPMVRKDGKWVLFDEYRATAKDVADWSREIGATGAEVAAAAATTGGVGTPMPILRGALGAGLGRGLFTGGSDLVAEYSMLDQFEPNEVMMRSMKEGAISSLSDYLGGHAMKYFGRMILPDGRVAPDYDMDEIMTSVREVEKELGESLPRTPAMSRTSEKFMSEQEIANQYSEGPKLVSDLANKKARGRDVAKRYVDAFTEGATEAWDQNYMRAAREIKELAANASASVERGKRSVVDALHNMAERRIRGLGQVSTKVDELGRSMQRDVMQPRMQKAKDVSDEMYQKVWDATADAPIKIRETSNAVLMKIDELNIPKDDKGVILDSFKNSKLGKIMRQADDVSDTWDVATLQDLHTWKQEVSKIASSSKDKKIKKDILGIVAEVDKMLMSEAKRLGVDGKLTAAIENYKATVVPFKSKGMGKITALDYDSWAMPGAGVGKQLFSGDEALENVRLYKQAMPDREATVALRDAYASHLWQASVDEATGLLDVKVMLRKMDDEMLLEIYGPNAVKNKKAIQTIMRELPGAQKVDPSAVESMFTAKSSKDVVELKAAIKEGMYAVKRQERILTNEVLASLKGDGEFASTIFDADPAGVMDIIMRQNRPTVRYIMKNMPEKSQEALKGEMEVWLLKEASRDGASNLQRTSVRMGREPMWDPDELRKLLNEHEDLIEGAIGKERYARMHRINNVVRAYTVRQISRPTEFTPRLVTNAGGMAGYFSFKADAIKHRLMAIAGRSKTMENIILGTELGDSFALEVLPKIAATKEGMRYLVEEGRKDPQFEQFVSEFLAESRK